MKKGLIVLQQQLIYCFITTCRRTRLENRQVAKLWETKCMGLMRLVIVHQIRLLNVPFLHQLFESRCFLFLFRFSFHMSFLFRFYFRKDNPLLSDIERKRHLFFAASVSNNITNAPPKFCCLLSIPFGHFLSENLDCLAFKGYSTDKKQRVLPISYDAMVFPIQ